MTKAKKPASAGNEEVKKSGTRAKPKAATKSESGEKRKKTAPKAKPVKEAAPKAEADKKQAKNAKPAAAPADKAAEARPPKREPKPEPAPRARKISPFADTGLAVMTGSKKPALSVAPGVMILGKPNAAKTDHSERSAERKLSKKELTEIQTALLEKRERLLAGMRREFAVQRERAESKAADEVDKATDAYDENLSFEITTANDQELSDIQVALEKIERGTYGECEICGCTISPSRLKILPSATTCVACRGQEEMLRRRDDNNLLFSMMNGDDGDEEVNDA